MVRHCRSGIGVLGVALFGSQLGHLIVFELRFGAQAMRIQTTGVHSYMPGLVGVAGAVAGGVLIMSLLLIAVARLLAGSVAGSRPRARASVSTLLWVLFWLQLAFFTTQETIESLCSAGSLPDPLTLVLWGSLGQLPVAFLGALVLSWLTVRFEAALEAIVEAVRRSNVAFGFGAAAPLTARHVDLSRLLSQTSGRARRKRGPPHSV